LIHYIYTLEDLKRWQQKILDNPDKYMDSWNVYQQKTDKLGNYVRTHKSKNGRTTHWVPNVQK
jgi:hypothetical protein